MQIDTASPHRFRASACSTARPLTFLMLFGVTWTDVHPDSVIMNPSTAYRIMSLNAERLGRAARVEAKMTIWDFMCLPLMMGGAASWPRDLAGHFLEFDGEPKMIEDVPKICDLPLELFEAANALILNQRGAVKQRLRK